MLFGLRLDGINLERLHFFQIIADYLSNIVSFSKSRGRERERKEIK